MKKRVFSMAITLIMVMCLIPGAASAEELQDSGQGPEESKYDQINTVVADTVTVDSQINEADPSDDLQIDDGKADNTTAAQNGTNVNTNLEITTPLTKLPPASKNDTESNSSAKVYERSELLLPLTLLSFCSPANTIDIPGEKIWNDKGYESSRPGKVNIDLYADGKKVEGKSLTLTSDKQWKGSFKDLPKYNNDSEIKYTVAEEALTNYDVSYTQPVAETASVSSWGEKITPASQSTYTLNGNIVVAKKGGQYFIWTLSALTDAQKNKVITSVNAANLQGLGKELATRNTVFANGLPAAFEKGNISITASGNKTQINFKKTNAWSLFYNGMLTATEATGWVVTNTYKAPVPPPDPDPATVIINATKTLDGEAPSGDDFTFTLKDKNENIIQTKNNDGADITFDALTFSDSGVYQYTLEEVVGADNTINYDNTVYNITINVSKDENGNYQAAVSYQKDGAAYAAIPAFANTTKQTPPTPPTPPEPTPDPGAPEAKQTAQINDAVQTGDDSSMTLWLILAVLSLLGVSGILFGRKHLLCRSKQDEK